MLCSGLFYHKTWVVVGGVVQSVLARVRGCAVPVVLISLPRAGL